MRVFVLFALVPLASCYSPQLSSPGFYCHPEDDPACPEGQVCIGNQCRDKSTVPPGADLAMNGGGDGGGPHDMAMSLHDFAFPAGDFSVPSFDFSQPPSDGGGLLCMCSTACIISCVGKDCCLEDAILMLCTPDPTCTPN